MTANSSGHQRLGDKRFLRRERAAGYLDISPGSFDKLVREGLIPAPKMLHTFRVWDVVELDALADSLPHDGEAAPKAPSDWD